MVIAYWGCFEALTGCLVCGNEAANLELAELSREIFLLPTSEEHLVCYTTYSGI